jgi:hypothetical protein
MLITISTVVFSHVHLIAQTSTARFLLWQPSAVSNAMGGAGVALHRDIYSVSYNPSALAFVPGVSAAGSFEKPIPFFGNIVYSFLGASVATRSAGAFAASVNLYSMGKQARTLPNGPDIIGVDEASHWQIKFSYAYAFSPAVAFGISANFLHIGLSKFGTAMEQGTGRTNALFADAGFLVREILQETTIEGRNETPIGFVNDMAKTSEKGISLGIAILNLGPKVSFIDKQQSDNLPAILCFGLSYSPFQSGIASFRLAADYRKSLLGDPTLDYVNLGGEVLVFKILALRAGYALDPTKPATSHDTFGFGIETKYFSVNIARYERTILPTWHYDCMISLEF